MKSKTVGIIGIGCLGEHIAKMLIRRPEISLGPISVLSNAFDSARKLELFHKFNGNIFELKHSGPISRPNAIDDNMPLILLENNGQVSKHSDYIILSVKPSQIKDICTEIKSYIDPNTPIISTAAAVPLDMLHKWLPESKNIIRCMPNIPCSIGEGTIIYHSHSDNIKIMNDIFAPNLVVRVKSDAEIDALTLIAGCGPAFYAWYNECLKSAVCGILEDDVVDMIMMQTMIGTACMLKTMSNNEIIKTVASPQGATEKTLTTLMDKNVDKEIRNALLAAKERIETISSRL